MREYFTRSARIDPDATIDAESYLARTVFEIDETFDIGVLDAAGNKILAREKRNPIGFVHFKD